MSGCFTGGASLSHILVRRLRRYQYTAKAVMIAPAPIATLTPMPALEPALKPLDGLLDGGVTVVGNETGGVCDWGCVDEVVLFAEESTGRVILSGDSTL